MKIAKVSIVSIKSPHLTCNFDIDGVCKRLELYLKNKIASGVHFHKASDICNVVPRKCYC